LIEKGAMKRHLTTDPPFSISIIVEDPPKSEEEEEDKDNEEEERESEPF